MFLQHEGEPSASGPEESAAVAVFSVCYHSVCVLVSTGAFVVAHFSGDCRLLPLHRQELLQTQLLPKLATLQVSSTRTGGDRCCCAAVERLSQQLHRFLPHDPLFH